LLSGRVENVRRTIRVGLVQAELRWRDPAANRSHLGTLLDRAEGTDLFVLPETFATGFLGDQDRSPESMDGPTVAWMRDQASSRKAAICGSLALADQGRQVNRFIFVDECGELLGHYDKRHLFGFGGEDERYTAGQAHRVIEWGGWRIDLQVCYDLRFPVWCRNDRKFDVQLFVANWPSPRIEAWRCLLRARALENQSYVLGVNRAGRDGNGIDYPGRSGAYAASGDCLVELDHRESLGQVVLERSELDEFRQRFRFLDDRDAFSLDGSSSEDDCESPPQPVPQ